MRQLFPAMIDPHDLEGLGQKLGDSDLPLAYRILYHLVDEKYRVLLDASSDFMCIADRDGKIIYANQHLVDSLGYTKKELLGRPLKDIVAPEMRPVFLDRTKTFLKKGKIRIEDFVLLTKYGGRVCGEMVAMAYFDNAGKYCGVRSVFKDGTRLREMERLEKKYEMMLEDGIDSLDQVILILDNSGTVRWASSSVQKYLGIDKTAVIGTDARRLFEDRLAPLFEDKKTFLAGLFAAYDEQKPYNCLECLLSSGDCPDGFTIELWSYPITQGALSGGRIEILRDSSARRQAEERLEYYHKKIHAIMEHAVEGIVEVRPDNTVEFINRSFLHMLGLTETDVLNRPLTDFILPDQRIYLASIKLIRRAREISFVRRDGSLLYTLASSIPLVFGGQPPHALCFFSNISETKLVSLKLRDANQTLRALNESLNSLTLRDARTGAYNARYLNERLEEEMRRSRRYGRPFSLILIDIDFFKTINDTYGHIFGDVILSEVARLLKEAVRVTDIVVRYGGDEFVVFLPDTGLEGAAAAARKIVRRAKETPLGDTQKKMPISLSVGVVAYPDAGKDDVASFLDAADQAMYRSKSRGHNRITVYRRQGLQAHRAADGRSPQADSFRKFQGRLHALNQHHEEAVIESLRPMVRQAALRLGYSDGFMQRIVKDVEALGMSLGLPEAEVRRNAQAAFLSHLGFLRVPSHILTKTQPLTDEERARVREHPFQSAQMIREISFLEPLCRIILCHHERYDGEGYPRGLKGEDIPLGARMIQIAEAYEAMLSPRPYRPDPFSEHAALDILRREAGRQFDPIVTEHFLRLAF
ncbi:MAG: diguanylate cyclase [Deltaproteobacteria bacterium]